MSRYIISETGIYTNYGRGSICPHYHARHHVYLISTRKQWQCKHCQYRFSITAGTIFQGAKLSLRKIMLAIFYFATESKGLTASNDLHYMNAA